jgi:polar amino acid transport system substrate-binding protein
VNRFARRARTAVLAAVALLATACGGVGTPVDPAPVTSVTPPQPPGVGGALPSGGGGSAQDCDPLKSLRPDAGTSVVDGSTMAGIKARGHLIAGVDQTTYLFGFRNPTTGNLEGFDIDIVRQVAKAIFGSDDPRYVQYIAIPSSARDRMLISHKVDIVVRTYSITCDRLKSVAFSSVYYVAGQRVLVPKSSNAQQLSDVEGKRVCATAGSTSLPTIQSDPKLVPVSVSNWSDCLVMLQQREVDAVSTDDVILAGMAAQDPTLKIVGPRFTQENYGVGIPQGEDDMVKFVNAVLDDIRGNGGWQSSYDRWLRVPLGEGSPPAAEYR